MVNSIQVLAIILAGVAVAIADMLIKKASLSGNYLSALKHPLMLLVLLLYLAQVIFFVYVFANNWQLGVVGNIQMVFYSIGVILLGAVVFGEQLSIIQYSGIALALIGVILINS